MAVGRPTKFTEGTLKDTEQYLSDCTDTYESRVESTDGGGVATKLSYRLQVKLPSIAGLAVNLKVARSTIYEWAKDHPEFSDILERILAEQERRLIENGLSGIYNATIVKLALGKHGYSDKSDTDITSGGAPITTLTDGDRAAIGELRDILKQRAA
jgi:hypothetical protein